MLRKLTTDVPFRSFGNSPFDHGDSSCLLGKTTIIYGRNGSGKTSLSEMLRLSALLGKADSSVVTASLRLSGATSSAKIGTAHFPLTVMVYNRFYVKDALEVFLEGTGASAPILKLGVVNVSAAKELAEIATAIAERTALRQRVLEKRETLTNDHESAERDIKRDIIAALAAGDAGKYNTAAYNVTRVRTLFGDSSKVTLAADVLKNKTEAANASVLARVEVPASLASVPSKIIETINRLLVEPVESEPIDRLISDGAVESWVEAGLELHIDGETCKFCQNGTVHADLLAAYGRHFSDSLKALRRSLLEVVKEFEDRDKQISAWEASLPSLSNVLLDRRKEIADETARVGASISHYREQAAKALLLLRERVADPLQALANDRKITSQIDLPDSAELIRLIEDNNTACETQDEHKASAQAEVEGHFSATGRDGYNRAKSRVSLADRCLKSIDRRLAALQRRETQLQESQQDTHAMAVLIDEDLHDHFGHSHLSVTVSDDGKGYIVRRGADVATMLSEGERNAIAFSYFMRTIEGDGVKLDKLVVVIDDPVTSLDKEALFAAFSLANARTEKVAQTIFLSHDYEYFRLLLSSVSSRRQKSEKKIREGNAEEIAFPAVSVLETVSRIDAGSGDRVCELRPLLPALLNHPTEYHYLFAKISGALTTSATDELPLLGNAARRLLEGFISFRAPHGNSFQEKIDAITRQNNIPSELSSRVVKFLHGHSHREDPSPISALDFPSVEAELKCVLQYMRLADGVHFQNMCRAVGVDETKLAASL